MDASPMVVAQQINNASNELDSISKELQAASREYGDAKFEYEKASLTKAYELYGALAAGGTRLPAEDIRRATIAHAIGWEAYGRMLSAKAEVDALKARANGVEAVMNGKQSVLKALREELA